MERAFLSLHTGNAYNVPSIGQIPSDAFAGYEVIAAPLADRCSRVLGMTSGDSGIDYGAYHIQLAISRTDVPYKNTRQLYILMHNGCGRSVLKMKKIYDQGATEAALLALPEAVLYGILFSMYKTADAARIIATSEESDKWKQAYVDNRIRRQKRRNSSSVAVWIDPARIAGESDERFKLRTICARP